FSFYIFFFFFSSRRRHTRFSRDWSSDVCSSDLLACATKLRTVPFSWRTPMLLKRFAGLTELNEGEPFTISVTGLKTTSNIRTVRSEERRVGKECKYKR